MTPTATPKPLEFWFIYHSTIPDGPIVPGADLLLGAYQDQLVQRGTVVAHFKTSADFDGGHVGYQKSGAWVVVERGGIRYDLAPVANNYPVTGAKVQVMDTCGTAGCIQLIGFWQGVEVSRVQSEAGIGQKAMELAPGRYDSFALVGYGSFSFDHWWIVIIVDP